MPDITLRGVVKRFDGFTLGPLDLTIPAGYVTGFVGANGSGKTTTIKTILGMLRPDEGTIDAPGREAMGVVLDSVFFDPDWTPALVGRVLAPFYPAWSPSRYAELLERFAVPADRKVRDLSRGMSMKLQLAASLAHEAEVLLLDEPTSGLDPLARDELLEILAEYLLDERRSVLFSTHITSDLERIADYVAVIDGGRIVRSATRDELLAAYRMVRGRGDAPEEVRAELYGLRENPTGWDALAPTDVAELMPAGTLVEAPSLDELVVRIAKGTGRVSDGANAATTMDGATLGRLS